MTQQQSLMLVFVGALIITFLSLVSMQLFLFLFFAIISGISYWWLIQKRT